MNYDLLKILSESNKDIDNQKLMDYLSGHLELSELREVEELMASNDFVNDAIEGLQRMNNQKKVEHLVEQLNRDLHKKLHTKKARKERLKIKEYPWLYFAIIILLLLIIASWFVIHRLNHPAL